MKTSFKQRASCVNSRRFTKIQSLRGISALAVVLYHADGVIGAEKYFNIVWPSYITHFGINGVIVVFVLSGFIIQHVHSDDFGRPERLRSYIFKPLMRIYPVFGLFLRLSGFISIGGRRLRCKRCLHPTLS